MKHDQARPDGGNAVVVVVQLACGTALGPQSSHHWPATHTLTAPGHRAHRAHRLPSTSANTLETREARLDAIVIQARVNLVPGTANCWSSPVLLLLGVLLLGVLLLGVLLLLELILIGAIVIIRETPPLTTIAAAVL